MRYVSAAAIVMTLLALAACRDSPAVTAPSPASPITATFTSILAASGAASRTFVAATAGTVSITLASVGPPAMAIGLGLGVPGGMNRCALTVSLTTEAGASPHISAAVNPGNYCVQVYDVGHVVDEVHFSVTIEHP